MGSKSSKNVVPLHEQHESVRKFEQVRNRLMIAHQELYKLSGELYPLLKEMALPGHTYVDLGIVFRDCESLANEIRKEAKVRKDHCARILCAIRLQGELQDGEHDGKFIGTIGSANTRIKAQAKLPKIYSKEWQDLLVFFGIPTSQQVDSKGRLIPIKFDYLEMELRVTEWMEMSEPLPPGLTDTYNVYEATFYHFRSVPKAGTVIDLEKEFEDRKEVEATTDE